MPPIPDHVFSLMGLSIDRGGQYGRAVDQYAGSDPRRREGRQRKKLRVGNR